MSIDHNNHDLIAELAAGYALGALDPDTTRFIEAHLPTCPHCSTAVAEMRGTVSTLAYAVEQVDPPAHVKQQLFARIRSEGNAAHAEAPVRPIAPPTESKRRSFWSLFSGSGGLMAAGVASLLLLLGLGALNLQQRDRIVDLEAQLARAATEVRVARTEQQDRIAELEAQLAETANQARVAETQQQERIAELEARLAETADQAKVARMQQDGMEARLFMVPNSRHAYIVIEGLPQPPEGRDWQVWLSPDAENLQPVSVGVFQDRSGKWVLEADQPIMTYEWVGVTLEPDGGSEAPTSPPVMGGNVQ